MNHLEEANRCIRNANVAEDIESCQYHMDDAKTHALIATAEINEARHRSQIRIEEFLHAIAEQLDEHNELMHFLVEGDCPNCREEDKD